MLKVCCFVVEKSEAGEGEGGRRKTKMGNNLGALLILEIFVFGLAGILIGQVDLDGVGGK